MQAIVAVDLKWGIGCQGNLLQRIPEDMKFFKEKTIGKVVIMGRETFASLPGQQPLKDRINIVLSRNENYRNDQVLLCRSLEELFRELKKYDPQDLFVIGGEAVYTQLIPYCTDALVTKIENTYPADKYFPDLDRISSWHLAASGEPRTYNGITYSYLTYRNKVPQEF